MVMQVGILAQWEHPVVCDANISSAHNIDTLLGNTIFSPELYIKINGLRHPAHHEGAGS